MEEKELVQVSVHVTHQEPDLSSPSGPQDYGETPQYLNQRREEVQRAQQEYDQYVSDRMKEGAMKVLSAEERSSIMVVRRGAETLLASRRY